MLLRKAENKARTFVRALLFGPSVMMSVVLAYAGGDRAVVVSTPVLIVDLAVGLAVAAESRHCRRANTVTLFPASCSGIAVLLMHMQRIALRFRCALTKHYA
ncbi:hypothetical protein [Chitinimonas sp.]|uniref:hypothetical protein n=1 Tax=Chitinimonas sp. TaxID=1934313 RepID=UPI0035B3CCAE